MTTNADDSVPHPQTPPQVRVRVTTHPPESAKSDRQAFGSSAVWHFEIGEAHPLLGSDGERTVWSSSDEPDWRRDELDTVLDSIRVVEVSDAAISLFGLPMDREHLLTWPVANLWPEQSHAALADILRAVSIKGDDAPELRRIGTVGWLDAVSLTAQRSTQTGLHGIIILTISGTVSAASALRELQSRQDRWRNMLSAMPIPIWQVDAVPAGKILDRLAENGVTDLPNYLAEHPALVDLAGEIVLVTQVNDAAVALLRASHPSQLIRSVEYLFAAAPGSHLRLLQAYCSGLPTYVEEIQVRDLVGHLQDVLFMVMFPGRGRRLESTILLMIDNTERIAAETKVRRIEADFARAARISTLGELTASLAHEVKQPISAMLTNAETSLRWLAKDPPNLAKVAQLNQRIVSSAQHANDVINRIQDMARHRAPHRGPLNFNEVVVQAVSFVRHDTDEHDIRLRLDLAVGLPPVRGDRVQLQQVVVNLLVNSAQALKSVGDGRREIHVRTFVSEAGIGLCVQDTGPGIPEGDLGRVFEGFFSTKDDGLGIGLAICQSIVAAHGGTITASNAAAGGAIFDVVIPVTPADTARGG